MERNPNHIFNQKLVVRMTDFFGKDVDQINFTEDSIRAIKPGSIIVSTIELEQPLLSTMTEQHLDLIKILTNSASVLVWITGGCLLTGSQPDFAIASAVSRTVMLEQPALKFLSHDIDDLAAEMETALDISYTCWNKDCARIQAIMNSYNIEARFMLVVSYMTNLLTPFFVRSRASRSFKCSSKTQCPASYRSRNPDSWRPLISRWSTLTVATCSLVS